MLRQWKWGGQWPQASSTLHTPSAAAAGALCLSHAPASAAAALLGRRSLAATPAASSNTLFNSTLASSSLPSLTRSFHTHSALLYRREKATRGWGVRGAEVAARQAKKDSKRGAKQQRQQGGQANARAMDPYAEVEASSVASAAPKQQRPPPPARRQPRVPTPADLSHPSSPFFQPLTNHRQQDLAEEDEDEDAASEWSADADEWAHDDFDTPRAPRSSAAAAAATSYTGPTFKDLRLASQVHTKLAPTFDIFHPTPIQSAAIPFLMDAAHFTLRERHGLDARGAAALSEADRIAERRRQRLRQRSAASLPRDLVIQDMTGSGKTLSYVLPMLSLIDNFSHQTQGVVVAPTRELAVQIYRIIRRLSESRKPGAKRKNHPLTVELAVGNMTPEYMSVLRTSKPHIVVTVPAAFHALTMGDKKDPTLRRAISFRHLRMVVLDEIDHLLLPFSAPLIQPAMESYSRSASHGSTHRLGRIIVVSAALSPRVLALASKFMNRPVTATSDGLLDGWIGEERLLKDDFVMPEEFHKRQARREEKRKEKEGQQQGEEEVEELYPEEVEIEQSLEQEDPLTDSSSLPVPASAARSLQELDPELDLDMLDEETRAVYEEADLFGREEDDEAEERAAWFELKRQDNLERARRGSKKEQQLSASDDSNAAAAEADAEAEPDLPEHVVRAEDFVLPGSSSAEDVLEQFSEEGTAEAEAEAVPVPLHARSLPAEDLPPVLDSSDSVTSTDPLSPDTSEPEAPLPPEAVYPSASLSPIRYLPPTLRHLAVHVPLSAKPRLREEMRLRREYGDDKFIPTKSKLLAQLHAQLRPRVALVFFNHGDEAVRIAEFLRRNKGFRIELLASGTGSRSRAEDRVRALAAAQAGKIDFLFATDLASRGLDIRGLTHVINFDLCRTPLDYVHRAGRVERLGGKKGCMVVNVVADWRMEDKKQEKRKKQEEAVDGEHASAPSSPPSTWPGPQVTQLRRLEHQLHLSIPSVILQAGKMEPLPAFESDKQQQEPAQVDTQPTQ